ncbi:MAG TPA: branched-chain amino acid ABC transporter permease [Ottowia sp.]|mgnify:CR=1 FL=1|uniref:branched-chain amino acid ABC transporter permease n=1 Tax=Ottowia sp. TaxID=1898956 RepID=UPI002BBA2778|nr:branched-chain amino acid ABC transporter permease [Ottowia sp.]HMN20951.1 branched-chain amino acid ABC transporter permease [Ottowia sp.]
MKMPGGRIGWGLLFVAGLLFPLVASNDYLLTVMATAYIFAIATLGLNLITGYTGQYNLAHAAFMAIGAYTVGLLTVDYEWPFWLAFVAGVVPVLVVGIPLGWLSLRLKGHYFAIFTLCLGYIIFIIIEKWEALTHGVVGVIGIPAPAGIPDTPLAAYYLVFAFLCLSVWLMLRIVNSLLGRTFMAIRNGDDLAQALGIHLARVKLLSFVISILYAGLAGGLYAGFVRFLSPDIASELHTFEMTMYMLVGGLGTVLGPLLGAILVPWVTQYLQFLADFRFIIFGPLLILMVIFAPHGIVGSYLERKARRAAAASPAAPAPAAGAGKEAPHA